MPATCTAGSILTVPGHGRPFLCRRRPASSPAAKTLCCRVALPQKYRGNEGVHSWVGRVDYLNGVCCGVSLSINERYRQMARLVYSTAVRLPILSLKREIQIAYDACCLSTLLLECCTSFEACRSAPGSFFRAKRTISRSFLSSSASEYSHELPRAARERVVRYNGVGGRCGAQK